MTPSDSRPSAPLAADAAPDVRRALLSALADGEATADDARRASALWHAGTPDAGDTRATWHAYRLIGDVLRSDDLAGDPGRDRAFLVALRARLAEEPVPLSPAGRADAPPQADAAPPAGRVAAAAGGAGRRPRAAALAARRWLVPMAAATGFVAVAGVLSVSRLTAPASEPTSPLVAQGDGSAPGGARVQTVAGSAGLQAARPLVVQDGLIRDAELDRYLQAHRDALGGAAVAVPGGGPRNVDTLSTRAR